MKFRITYEDAYLTTKTMVYDGANYWEAEKFSKSLGSKVISIDSLDGGTEKLSYGYPFISEDNSDCD